MMMMKNMNSSNRDGSGANYKEGTKLLDIDSDSTDSDTHEHFSLPPLDLKGARKKQKSKFGNDATGNGCCPYWRGFAVILLLLILTSTAVVGYVTYKLHLEVAELREKVSPTADLLIEIDREAGVVVDWHFQNSKSHQTTSFYLGFASTLSKVTFYKLDPQTKINVDFKPSKKMKKRRELDALVNGKSGTGRRKKKGQHELLRNDTDSSDVEEFAITDKTVVRKRSSAGRFCSTCVAVTSFFLLTACIITIGGLVWVHIDLKREVDQLRSDLTRVENGIQGNPNEFHDLHSSVKELQNNQTVLKSLIKYDKENISDIFKQLQALNSTTQSLTSSLASAPTLKTLPKSVQDLSEEVAKMGSNIAELKTARDTVQGFKETTSKQIEYLQGNLTLIDNLHRILESLNGTFTTEINSLKITAANQTAEIANSTRNINLLLYRTSDENLTPGVTAIDSSQIRTIVDEEIRRRNLTEKISAFTSEVNLSIQDLRNSMNEYSTKIGDLQRQLDTLNSSIGSVAPSPMIDTTLTPKPSTAFVPQPQESSEIGDKLPTVPPPPPSTPTPLPTDYETGSKDEETMTENYESNTPHTDDRSLTRRGIKQSFAEKNAKESIIKALERSNNQ